jgi:hypothetical protein
LGTRALLCVAPSDAPCLTMACGLEEVDHLPSLLSPVLPSLGSHQL